MCNNFMTHFWFNQTKRLNPPQVGQKLLGLILAPWLAQCGKLPAAVR
jgi:hypothetical protein